MRKTFAMLLCAVLFALPALAETDLTVYDEGQTASIRAGARALQSARADARIQTTDDYAHMQRILSDLLTGNDGVDLYAIRCWCGEFEAARDRGYMLDLGESEALQALCARMYPNLAAALSQGGRLCAFPVDATVTLPRADAKALAALGLSAGDIPGNWTDFFLWLPELAEAIPEESGVSLLGADISAEEARRQLFYAVFSAYQIELGEGAVGLKARLTDCLSALEAVDFAALGQPEEVADWQDADETPPLLRLNVETGLSRIAAEESASPLVMAFDALGEARLPVCSHLLFINPHTKNAGLALAFVEAVASELDDASRYCLYADLTEPIANPEYETLLESARQNLENVQKRIAEAEPGEKQAFADALRAAEEWVESAEGDRWLLGPEDIAWYQSNAEALLFQPDDWLFRDETGEASGLVQRYLDGMMRAGQFAEAIEAKLGMMIRENE